MTTPADFKHTPGPWRIRRIVGIAGSIAGGVMRKYARGDGQDQLFIVCCPSEDNGGCDAQEANARLTAAAPDMLAALQAYVHAVAVGGGSDKEAVMAAIRAADDAARAVIARATGATA